MGCTNEGGFPFSRTLTSTVAVGGERILVVDVPVAVEITAAPLRTDVFVELDLVVTASTATRARVLAESVTLEILRPDSSRVKVTFAELEDGNLSGVLRVQAPPVLGLEVGSLDLVSITGMEGDVFVASVGPVKVAEAEGDVRVDTRGGNVIIDAELPPGAEISASTGGGDIELAIPARPSVDVEAAINGQGQIYVTHPALPAPISAVAYQATVSGGLASARLLTQGGSIVIRARE